jgi:hypothetical protein
MSAEGILRDPAIFSHAYNTDCADTINNEESVIPDRNELFQEYCDLSELYEKAGGWMPLLTPDNQSSPQTHTKTHSIIDNNKSECTVLDKIDNTLHPQYRQQIYVARQHLTWMLGKSGHGRCVRYEYLGTHYTKHTQLLNALNEAMTIADLRVISANCLVGVQGSSAYNPESGGGGQH